MSTSARAVIEIPVRFGTSDWFRRVFTYPVVREREIIEVLGSAPDVLAARERMSLRLVDPDEARDYMHVVVENYWTDVPIGDEWIAAFRFTPQDGQPVISEVRIYPAEGKPMGPGRWSAELLGAHAPVPAGGLTSRIVHKARLGTAIRAARVQLARLPRAPHLFGPGADYAPFTASDARSALTRRGPGRKGHGLAFFAELASAYCALLDAGNPRPVVTLAHERNLAAPRIRDMIHRARKLGLLTSAPHQGQRGGSLTPKARAILKVAQGKQRKVTKSRRKPR